MEKAGGSANPDEYQINSDTERFIKVAFEETDTAIFISDSKGRCFDVNPRALSLTGYSEQELIGKVISGLLQASDPAPPNLRSSFQKGKTVTIEGRLRRKDGGLLSVELRILKLSDGNFLETARDITEQKAAEETLRKNEELFRIAFDDAPTGMSIIAPDGVTYLAVNPHLCEMFGYSREEFLGRTIHLVTHPDDEELSNEWIKKKFNDEPCEPVLEKRYIHKNGNIIWGLVSAHWIKNDDGSHRMAIAHIQDITDRKQAEEERKKLENQVRQAQKMESIGLLAGGVAHDFNNMLGVILGHAELAMLNANPKGSIHVALKAIHKAARRSADLARQLLAFARKQTVAPKVLDLNETVASMLKMLLRLIGEEINLVWKPGAGVWPVKMDPSQIDQLLANLCINARDAIAGVGKVTIETSNITLDEAYCNVHPGFNPGEYVVLAVSDDGCGITADVKNHLFEPYFTTKDMGKGTGLGLATVYGIVKQNKGFINVYSEPGNGSTFKIYLARFAEGAVEAISASTAVTPNGRGETLLFVEDEPEILEVGRTMLERLGYKVLTAGTPGEALRQARTHAAEIQLLITDVVMPEMNGRQLEKLISDIKPGLKCLFTSGYTVNVIAHRGVLEKGVNFLPKPFSLEDLALKVGEALEQD